MKYEKKKQRVASKRRKTQKFISVKYEKFTELTVGPRGNSGAGEPTGHPHGLKPIRRSHS